MDLPMFGVMVKQVRLLAIYQQALTPFQLLMQQRVVRLPDPLRFPNLNQLSLRLPLLMLRMK